MVLLYLGMLIFDHVTAFTLLLRLLVPCVMQVDQTTLFDLILAANYLNIKSLLDLTCQTVAQMIKGKTPEEIRKQFNIKNDFTPEEEEEVRRENQVCCDTRLLASGS